MSNPADLPEDYIQKQYDRLTHLYDNLPPLHNALCKEIFKCRRCDNLVYSRKLYKWGKPTYGFGDPKADIFLIAQSPGYKGCGTTGFVFEPLSRTGRVFEECLGAAGLSFEKVWTSNLVKCCPKASDTPNYDNIVNCSPYMLREIRTVKPKSVISVGKIAYEFVVHTRLFNEYSTFHIRHPGYPLRKMSIMKDYMKHTVETLNTAKLISKKQMTMSEFV